jgi:hypothetical protein
LPDCLIASGTKAAEAVETVETVKEDEPPDDHMEA